MQYRQVRGSGRLAPTTQIQSPQTETHTSANNRRDRQSLPLYRWNKRRPNVQKLDGTKRDHICKYYMEQQIEQQETTSANIRWNNRWNTKQTTSTNIKWNNRLNKRKPHLQILDGTINGTKGDHVCKNLMEQKETTYANIRWKKDDHIWKQQMEQKEITYTNIKWNKRRPHLQTLDGKKETTSANIRWNKRTPYLQTLDGTK